MAAIVCYFIQSHRDPEQIYRLVRTLRRSSRSARIIVQHNSAGCSLDWAPIADLPDTHRFEAKAPQVRANFSCQVQPYLDALAWLEREGIRYDWIVNLSAQDYPVQPVSRIESFLEASSADGLIRYWSAESPDNPWSWRKFRWRYGYRYRRLPAGAEPLLRILRPFTRVLPIHFYLDYGPLVGVPAPTTPFGPAFPCFGGWAWFSLRRVAARHLLEFLAEHPEVEEHYRGTVTPEESLVQTILVNARRFQLVNDDFRYIDYSRARSGSPRTLDAGDLPLLSSGRYHFARKFDWEGGREVLDRIDRELLGLEPGG